MNTYSNGDLDGLITAAQTQTTVSTPRSNGIDASRFEVPSTAAGASPQVASSIESNTAASKYQSEILVIGCNGTVGRHVAESLLAQSVPIRVTLRSHDASEWEGRGAEVVTGFDLDQASTIAQALVGVKRLFFSTTFTQTLIQQGLGLLERARDAGVEYIVRLSSGEAEAGDTQHGRWHRLLEQRIESLGFKYTIVRSNLMFQSLLRFCPDFPTTGRLRTPIEPTHRISWVDARDVARVATSVLLDRSHEGDSYTITGCESLTLLEIADALSAHLGSMIEIVTETSDECQARLVALGWDEATAEAVRETLEDYGQTEVASEISNDYESVCDQTPCRFAQFLQEVPITGGSV
jgi:uncharacterized protein YbjT (DUF2867 family)